MAFFKKKHIWVKKQNKVQIVLWILFDFNKRKAVLYKK